MSKVLKAEEADIMRLGKDRHGKTLREIRLFSKKYIQSTTLGILGVSHMGFIPMVADAIQQHAASPGMVQLTPLQLCVCTGLSAALLGSTVIHRP